MKKDICLTADEMRAVDAYTIERIGVPGIALMENAGKAVSDACRMLSKGKRTSVTAVCGGGNNGGDGFVAVRHLFNCGYDTKIIITRPEEEYKGDAFANLKAAGNMGIPVYEYRINNGAPAEKMIKSSGIIVDALLGTGSSGEIREPYRKLITLMNEAKGYVVAVDIPSGLSAGTDNEVSIAVKADITVTMGALKKAFASKNAKKYTGKVIVAEIGMPVSFVLSKLGKEEQIW